MLEEQKEVVGLWKMRRFLSVRLIVSKTFSTTTKIMKKTLRIMRQALCVLLGLNLVGEVSN